MSLSNFPRLIKLDVYGKIIEVHASILHQMPPIIALIENENSGNEKLDTPIIYDTYIFIYDTYISPRFLKIITNFLVNKQQISYLIEILTKEFEKDYILNCFKYLMTNEFIDMYYYPYKIMPNGKLFRIAVDIRWNVSHRGFIFEEDREQKHAWTWREDYGDIPLKDILIKLPDLKNYQNDKKLDFIIRDKKYNISDFNKLIDEGKTITYNGLIYISPIDLECIEL